MLDVCSLRSYYSLFCFFNSIVFLFIFAIFSCQVFSNATMMSTAYDPGQQYSTFGKKSPGFNTPDPVMSERATVFTPAYAHPMHQPQQKSNSKCYQQQQEEKKGARKEEKQWKKEEEKKRITYESKQQNFRPRNNVDVR